VHDLHQLESILSMRQIKIYDATYDNPSKGVMLEAPFSMAIPRETKTGPDRILSARFMDKPLDLNQAINEY